MPKEQIELLIEFTKDEDARTRATAIAGLSKVHDPRSFAPVVVGLFDPVDEVRIAAAVALGVMHDNRAFEPLVECLKDPCEKVTVDCAWALGQIADLRCVGKLVEIAADESMSMDVRTAAVTAIGDRAEIGGSDLATTDALIDQARDGLIKVIELGVGDLSAAAIWSLGHLPPTDESLEACMKATESDHEWTVLYAIEALTVFRDHRAHNLLVSLCDDRRPSVSQMAMEAMKRI